MLDPKNPTPTTFSGGGPGAEPFRFAATPRGAAAWVAGALPCRLRTLKPNVLAYPVPAAGGF